jgi:hypothetical protein
MLKQKYTGISKAGKNSYSHLTLLLSAEKRTMVDSAFI